MNARDLSKFKALLTTKQAELAPHLRMRDGMAIEKTSDTIDAIQAAAARELVTRTLERESKVMREVRAALERIEEGGYGTCLNCEGEISPRRLNAVPWAPLCIDCQEEEDRKRQNFDELERWAA